MSRTGYGQIVFLSGLAPGFYEVILTVTNDADTTFQDSARLAAVGPASCLAGNANGDNHIDLSDIVRSLQVLGGQR